jgi:GNAT superfamily N-acetyltransferase
MNEGVSMRLAPIREVDLGPVADLVNRAFRRYRDIWTGERTSPEEYLDEAGEDCRILLVEEGGRLVATSMVADAMRFADHSLLGPSGVIRTAPTAAEPIPAEHPWRGTMYYGFAGVEPEIMNGGLGKMMLEFVERLAAQEGARGVSLATIREFGLVDYYTRFGYRVIREEEFPEGHWDFLVPHHYCDMVKDL